MVDITIQDLDLITSPSLLANGDIFHFQDASDSYNDKVAALSAMAEFILREKTIPSVGNEIVTDSATQTLTNKRLQLPKINSTTSTTATSEEINTLDGIVSTTSELNKLHGVTASTTEINYLTGVTDSIQTQINSLGVAQTAKIFTYDTQETGTPEVIITEIELRSHAGLGSSHLVSHRGLLVKVWHKTSSGLYEERDNDGLLPIITVTSKRSTDSLQEMLDKIIIQYQDNQEMIITVHYKVIEKAGV